jgi:hypothetical protein
MCRVYGQTGKYSGSEDSTSQPSISKKALDCLGMLQTTWDDRSVLSAHRYFAKLSLPKRKILGSLKFSHAQNSIAPSSALGYGVITQERN